MMEVLLIVTAFLLIVLGIVGCVVPMLPGTPLSYAGILLLHFTEQVQFTTTQLIVWLLLVIILQVLDYITPMFGSKYSGGTTYGNRGCIAGTIVGLFFMPWGIILGPFFGAVIGEMLGGRDLNHALRAGIGSLIGFVLGTLLKVIIGFYFLYEAIAAIV
ncbi:MAG: DUF456 domain-containing protein [Bacteroides sp.]|nr:DUF456 domain-containing protein [Bacteroides sp.]